jgi:hypothetical protein
MDAEVPKTSLYLDAFEAKQPTHYATVHWYSRYFFDSFMDVLGSYIDWREAKKQPRNFMDRQLAEWGQAQWIPEYPTRIVERLLEQDTVMLWINDDATISTALCQLVVDGKILPGTRTRELVCTNRQLMIPVVRKRSYTDSQDATECLLAVKRCLEAKL